MRGGEGCRGEKVAVNSIAFGVLGMGGGGGEGPWLFFCFFL